MICNKDLDVIEVGVHYTLFILNVKGVEAFFNTNLVIFSMEANSEDTFASSTFFTLPDLFSGHFWILHIKGTF